MIINLALLALLMCIATLRVTPTASSFLSQSADTEPTHKCAETMT